MKDRETPFFIYTSCHGRATCRETCTCGSGRGPRYTVLICVGPRKSSHSPTFTLKKGHVQHDCFLLGLILNRKRSPFAFSLSFRWDRKASTPFIALSARYRSVGYDKHRNKLLQKNALRERLLPGIVSTTSSWFCFAPSFREPLAHQG
nr:hypothetical protein [Bidens alba var. radiata]